MTPVDVQEGSRVMSDSSRIASGRIGARRPVFQASCFDNADSWERWLKEHYPPPSPEVPALNRLVQAGCDREKLIECLMHLPLTDGEKLTKDDVREAVSAIDGAAEWIRRIDLSDQMGVVEDIDTEELVTRLSDYEYALERALKEGTVKNRRWSNRRDDLIATLVRHVRRTTRRLFNLELSVLINVALPDRVVVKGGKRVSRKAASAGSAKRPLRYKRLQYSLDAHAHWRNRHKDLLEQETATERAWKKASLA
jgi:hypothetical protein